MKNIVQIIPYEPQYRAAFKEINEWWVSKYFKIEASDTKTLHHPKKNVLDKGGFIFIALLNEEPVGTSSLLRLDADGKVFELSKMGVLEKAQGMKIGWKLGIAAIEKAREIGAKKLYLESNRILTPALTLYRKLGFVELPEFTSPYERADIAMELVL